MRDYDVVVCGGGIAGVAAALASARGGAKTLLLEKEYALGGLATLGLICIYLPLDDGDGVKMSGGIAEELLKLSLKYGPGEIPEVWKNDNATVEERKGIRYRVEYKPASLMIAAEELLIKEGVDILYDARMIDVVRGSGKVEAIVLATKLGSRTIKAKVFIDATGDADVCYFAGEDTVDDDTNRRTGWYYRFDGSDLKLVGQTDPLYKDIPATSRLYSGTKIEDITANCIDGRQMILRNLEKFKAEGGNPDAYPLIIPAYHGLRMTRRLAGFEFSEDNHNYTWFDDCIGMIGNWKHLSKRYAIPYSTIKAVKNDNLYACGRCSSADKSGWDLTRVIPTCAVTGEACGTAAAMQVKSSAAPEIRELQAQLMANGVPIDRTLFN